jgi:hypothetical protein
MNFYNKTIYNILQMTRNKNVLTVVNRIGNIEDSNQITKNIYLGNIIDANNVEFLRNNNIGAILNCTEDEPFNEYFDDKYKYRLSINDSKSINNINTFKKEIMKAIDFIDFCIDKDVIIYVHCYWGLMRSATVVACYFIKEYKMKPEDAVEIIQEQRNFSLSSLYNFNEILEYVYKEIKTLL